MSACAPDFEAPGQSRRPWPWDVGSDLCVAEIGEYLQLWDLVLDVELRPAEDDRVHWTWEASGKFSARSAYASQFFGREHDPAAMTTWDSRAPLRCKLFAWLAFKDRLWTSDRLARRGLPHQEACSLCCHLSAA